MNPDAAPLPRGAHVEHRYPCEIFYHRIRFVGLMPLDVEITGKIEGVPMNRVGIRHHQF